MQATERALFLAFARAGSNKAARMPIIPITVSNSMSEKARTDAGRRTSDLFGFRCTESSGFGQGGDRGEELRNDGHRLPAISDILGIIFRGSCAEHGATVR